MLDDDYFIEEVLTISDQPVNILNPDKENNTCISKIRKTTLRDCELQARYRTTESLKKQCKNRKLLLPIKRFSIVLLIVIACSIFPLLKFNGINIYWPQYFTVVTILCIPCFNFGKFYYDNRFSKKSQMYLNLKAMDYKINPTDYSMRNLFLSDLTIVNSNHGDAFRDILEYADELSGSNKINKTTNIFEKRLICDLESTDNYQIKTPVSVLLNIFVFAIAMILQIIDFPILASSDSLQTMTNIIIHFAVAESLFAFIIFCIGFYAAKEHFYRNLTILKLGFVFSGYLMDDAITWHKVIPLKQNNSNVEFIKYVIDELNKNGIRILYSQIKIIGEDSPYLATSDEKQIDSIKKYIKA